MGTPIIILSLHGPRVESYWHQLIHFYPSFENSVTGIPLPSLDIPLLDYSYHYKEFFLLSDLDHHCSLTPPNYSLTDRYMENFVNSFSVEPLKYLEIICISSWEFLLHRLNHIVFWRLSFQVKGFIPLICPGSYLNALEFPWDTVLTNGYCWAVQFKTVDWNWRLFHVI